MSSRDASGTKPLKSRAWRYFRIKDKELKLANCKICQNVLSYRTSVTNLLKHVRKRHKKALLPVLEDTSDKSENGEFSSFSVSENEDDDCNNDDVEDNKNIKVLDSLENKNEEESVCLLCQETFPDQNSDQMMKHMVKVHNISEIKLVDGSIHLVQEESKPVENTRSKRSLCWDYFTVKDKESKLAVCNLCDRQLSYNTSVSNLVKHVRRLHHIIPKQCQDKISYSPQSAIWSFFNYVNDEKTVCSCAYCHKNFNVVDGLMNMKKHLLDKHPEALLHHKTDGDTLIFAKTNDDNNEWSDDDNIEEEYLDFDDLDRQDKIKINPSFERKSNFERKSSFDRRPSFNQRSSFERKSKRPQICRSPVRSVTHTKLPDSLEHFSNYITSLLQELPEHISKKLQMNFVKQIIEAQISCVEMECNRKEDVVTHVNSTMGTVADATATIEDAVTVHEALTTTSSSIGNNDGVVTIANGIIIRPVVSTS